MASDNESHVHLIKICACMVLV